MYHGDSVPDGLKSDSATGASSENPPPSSTEQEEIAREAAREIYTQIEASHYSFDVVREIILAALTKASSLKKTPDSLGT